MIKSVRTGAYPTGNMAVTILEYTHRGTGNLAIIEYLKCADYLPGLKYWHVGGRVHATHHKKMVEGIRKLMRSDVEVTFDTDFDTTEDYDI